MCACACLFVHVCACVIMPITPEVKAKVGYTVRLLKKGRKEDTEGEREISGSKDPNSPPHTQVSGRENPGPQHETQSLP